MVEITETGIELKKDQIDRFCQRLRSFLEDAFRDSINQISIPIDDRIVEFEYTIKS